MQIPDVLKHRPFTLQEARIAGLSRKSLRGKSWRHIGRGLYCWAGLELDAWKVLLGWQRILPTAAVFAGRTAVWLHGIDLDPVHPVEVIVPPHSGARSRHGLHVRHSQVDATVVRGLRATSIERTLADLRRQLSPLDALIVFDAAVRLRLIERTGLAEPAESPMETRLRWLLMQSGLPKPQVQKDVRDDEGTFIGRADLYYPSARLIREYDGTNHRDRLVEDNPRQNLLLNAGYRLLRFTAADINGRPDVVTAQVRQQLALASETARRAGAA